MRKFLTPLVGVFLLAACGLTLPAHPSAVVWGIPYTPEVVPDGSLAPYGGRTVGYRVRIEAGRLNTFTVAHELTHVWQWHHRVLAREWQGRPCLRQPAWNCSALEAQADAVGVAAEAAGCLPGDFGWPGQPASGCILPDPAAVRP